MFMTTRRISWPSQLLWLIPALITAAAEPLDRRSEQTQALCGADFNWMTNSQNLSPCYLSAAVWGSCFTGNWNVPALTSGQQYDNPNATTANVCSCSWAAYNLLSACTACQGITGSVQNWAAYMGDCGGFLTDAYFPANVTLPSGTAIPYWATINPTLWQDAHFNTGQAQGLAQQGKPDVIQGQTPPTAGHKSKTPIGAIVGGVVGGIAVLVLGGILAWWLLRKPSPKSGVQELDPAGVHPYMLPSILPAHGRSLSDLSAKSTMNQAIGSLSVITSQRPGTIYTTGTAHTHTGSVHSLSYAASGQMSPMRVVSPPPAIHLQTAREGQELRVEPFDIHTSRPQLVTRKTSETTITAYSGSHGHETITGGLGPTTPIAGPGEIGHRERLNPPAYSPYASPATSPEPTEQVFHGVPPSPTRPPLGHRTHPEKVSVDSQQSWSDATTSQGHGRARSDGSTAAIDEVVGRMGLPLGAAPPQNLPENVNDAS
ncbi:hypothetical protein FB45DRAFT_906459 [Roridomyces roridus]|uniref:Transmembrane protein n=1 Tax=Roridomyces roridus TaxID=1738132 RepID=A0AAD7C128_9AGAR|nr:hypothetical protein FB45DRAFT_906459 [Roridomyces roridus]